MSPEAGARGMGTTAGAVSPLPGSPCRVQPPAARRAARTTLERTNARKKVLLARISLPPMAPLNSPKLARDYSRGSAL
jgi:hypothetical protein